MNILFLTLLDFESIEENNIYTDLLREFSKHGHSIYVISPIERRRGQNTHLIENNHSIILKLKSGNIQKTNVIEKGISTFLIEQIFIHGIKKYFSDVKFDLVIYSTPPITFGKAVEYVKNRDEAKTYLLLKDIFPQNAVDIGMMRKTGIKGVLYRYFRAKEKKLYVISDYIGCMSQANVDYVIRHNIEVDPKVVEICSNSIEIIDKSVDENKRIKIRQKYNIPLGKRVFVYGGNLGKPQGIEFLIKCLYNQRKNKKVFFLIVGDGTEYKKIEVFFQKHPQNNIKLMKRLPKEDFDTMVGACDVGMIFLDSRFTIPNFPSRLLSYMQAKIPVLACTDKHTDIGKVIVEGNFGWWCESDSVKGFNEKIEKICNSNIVAMGENSFRYLQDNYCIEKNYETIIKHFKHE